MKTGEGGTQRDDERMKIQIIEGILIPFLGTSLGATMVFFLKQQMSGTVQKALTGFAAGVMVAASFWSLLQPALESSATMGTLAFLPASIGFLIGIGFLLLLDVITPHMHMDRQNEGLQSGFKRTTKLSLITDITMKKLDFALTLSPLMVEPDWRS